MLGLPFFSWKDTENDESETDPSKGSVDALKKQSIEEKFIKMKHFEVTEGMITRAARAAGPFWDGSSERRKSA